MSDDQRSTDSWPMWPIALVMIVIGYLGSTGPVAAYVRSSSSGPSDPLGIVVSTVYWPLIWLAEKSTLVREALNLYTSLFLP